MAGHPVPGRVPSPAEVRTGLDPHHVDVLAAQLHALDCVPVFSSPVRNAVPSEHHRERDRCRARFLLLGLRDHRLTVSPLIEEQP